MAYTPWVSTDWETGDHITAAGLATYIFDNLVYLKAAADTREICIQVLAYNAAWAEGTYLAFYPVSSFMVGFDLTKVTISCYAKSTSGKPNILIFRGRQANPTSAHTWVSMTSTNVTIDENEYCSKDAAVPAVIDTSNDDIAEGDLIRIDIPSSGAGTGTQGCWVVLEFTKP